MRRFDRAINFSSSTDLYGDILTFAYGVNLWNVNAYCATVLCLFPLSFFCTVQHSKHMVHQIKKESYLVFTNIQFTQYRSVLGLKLIALSNRLINAHILPWGVSNESWKYKSYVRITSVRFGEPFGDKRP